MSLSLRVATQSPSSMYFEIVRPISHTNRNTSVQLTAFFFVFVFFFLNSSLPSVVKRITFMIAHPPGLRKQRRHRARVSYRVNHEHAELGISLADDHLSRMELTRLSYEHARMTYRGRALTFGQRTQHFEGKQHAAELRTHCIQRSKITRLSYEHTRIACRGRTLAFEQWTQHFKDKHHMAELR